MRGKKSDEQRGPVSERATSARRARRARAGSRRQMTTRDFVKIFLGDYGTSLEEHTNPELVDVPTRAPIEPAWIEHAPVDEPVVSAPGAIAPVAPQGRVVMTVTELAAEDERETTRSQEVVFDVLADTNELEAKIFEPDTGEVPGVEALWTKEEGHEELSEGAVEMGFESFEPEDDAHDALPDEPEASDEPVEPEAIEEQAEPEEAPLGVFDDRLMLSLMRVSPFGVGVAAGEGAAPGTFEVIGDAQDGTFSDLARAFGASDEDVLAGLDVEGVRSGVEAPANDAPIETPAVEDSSVDGVEVVDCELKSVSGVELDADEVGGEDDAIEAFDGEPSGLEEISRADDAIKELAAVRGVGEVRAAQLHRELGIAHVKEIIEAGERGELRMLKGVGPRTETAMIEAAREALEDEDAQEGDPVESSAEPISEPNFSIVEDDEDDEESAAPVCPSLDVATCEVAGAVMTGSMCEVAERVEAPEAEEPEVEEPLDVDAALFDEDLSEVSDVEPVGLLGFEGPLTSPRVFASATIMPAEVAERIFARAERALVAPDPVEDLPQVPVESVEDLPQAEPSEPESIEQRPEEVEIAVSGDEIVGGLSEAREDEVEPSEVRDDAEPEGRPVAPAAQDLVVADDVWADVEVPDTIEDSLALDDAESTEAPAMERVEEPLAEQAADEMLDDADMQFVDALIEEREQIERLSSATLEREALEPKDAPAAPSGLRGLSVDALANLNPPSAARPTFQIDVSGDGAARRLERPELAARESDVLDEPELDANRASESWVLEEISRPSALGRIKPLRVAYFKSGEGGALREVSSSVEPEPEPSARFRRDEETTSSKLASFDAVFTSLRGGGLEEESDLSEISRMAVKRQRNERIHGVSNEFGGDEITAIGVNAIEEKPVEVSAVTFDELKRREGESSGAPVKARNVPAPKEEEQAPAKKEPMPQAKILKPTRRKRRRLQRVPESSSRRSRTSSRASSRSQTSRGPRALQPVSSRKARIPDPDVVMTRNIDALSARDHLDTVRMPTLSNFGQERRARPSDERVNSEDEILRLYRDFVIVLHRCQVVERPIDFGKFSERVSKQRRMAREKYGSGALVMEVKVSAGKPFISIKPRT